MQNERFTKLEDSIIRNETKYPEIFGLTEAEVIEAKNGWLEYAILKKEGNKNTEAYNDWLKMYKGIHSESSQEIEMRSWFACIRWIKAKMDIPSGCSCLTEADRWDCSKQCASKPKLVQS